jgi:hypothetical protein
MSDKANYRIIADELKTKNIDTALWMQAKESAGGDADKTEAAYIRLRFLELIKSSLLSPQTNSFVNNTNTNTNTKTEAKLKENNLSRIRTELAKKLLNQEKHSLYSTLKLHPDASDAVIATAIGDLDSGNLAASGINPAEFKYAKEMLSNPDLREQYDRQLLESISNTLRPYRFQAVADTCDEYSWWESRKMSIIIWVLSLSLFGYLGLSYLKEHHSNQIQQEVTAVDKDAIHSTSDTEQMRVQADIALKAKELSFAQERQSQDMQFRARVADQIYDQQRMMQESRMQAEQQRQQTEQQRQQAQKEQAENIRIAREKQYYTCMNQQLTVQTYQRDPNSYNAGQRCAMYR